MKAYKTPDYRMSDHPVIEYLKMLEEESREIEAMQDQARCGLPLAGRRTKDGIVPIKVKRR